ncbi:DUF397 domain-containing protein [Streptomyces sp. NPDC006879]|uniref:DUF397 domain-containing protein n=1 Tax=Streptomyces sp. NPDC006879 TaxID=3364767 RepID=UPI0036950498
MPPFASLPPPDPERGTRPVPSQSPWLRSSRSTGMNNCVEAAFLSDGRTAARDSKRPADQPLFFTAPSWTRFLAHLRRADVRSLG